MKRKDSIIAHIPLHNIDEIISFSYIPASPNFMAECAKRHISFCVLNQYGKLRYRVIGETHGNPLLRKAQYEKMLNNDHSLEIAKIFISGKIKNSCAVISKYRKNHRDESESLEKYSKS